MSLTAWCPRTSKVYERALAHDEQHPDLYYNLGVVHIERGVPDQAWLPDGHSQIVSVCVCVPSGLKDYTHTRSPPWRYDRLGEGSNFAIWQPCDQALYYFDKALELDPDHVQALMNSAILMQETGRPEYRPAAYERLFKVKEKDCAMVDPISIAKTLLR